jgi:hypothetical protein
MATYETRGDWESAQGGGWTTAFEIDWSANAAYDFGPDGTGDGLGGIGDGTHTVANEAELIVDTYYDRRSGADPATFAVVNGTGLRFVADGANDYVEWVRNLDDMVSGYATSDVIWYGAHFVSTNMAIGMTSAAMGGYLSIHADEVYTSFSGTCLADDSGAIKVLIPHVAGVTWYTAKSAGGIATANYQMGFLLHENTVSWYHGTGATVPQSPDDISLVVCDTGHPTGNIFTHQLPDIAEQVSSSALKLRMFMQQGSTGGTLHDCHCTGEIMRRFE